MPTGFSVASVLVELRKYGFPDEKGQRAGWCPGWWYQEWPGSGFLFLPAQVSQDAVDNVLVLDASNYPDSTSATATDLNVYTENAFKTLRPGHRSMTLGG